MIAFIDDHREVHGVEPICKVLPIAPSIYHDYLAKRANPAKLSAKAKRDLRLKPVIERVFVENFEVYGVRKVWRQLNRENIPVARCTVERLMADLGLQGVIRGKPIRTTVQDKAAHARLITCTGSSTRRRRTCADGLAPCPPLAHRQAFLPVETVDAVDAGRLTFPPQQDEQPSVAETSSLISEIAQSGAATTPCSTSQPWRRDSNETASGKPGAVQDALPEGVHPNSGPVAGVSGETGGTPPGTAGDSVRFGSDWQRWCSKQEN